MIKLDPLTEISSQDFRMKISLMLFVEASEEEGVVLRATWEVSSLYFKTCLDFKVHRSQKNATPKISMYEWIFSSMKQLMEPQK